MAGRVGLWAVFTLVVYATASDQILVDESTPETTFVEDSTRLAEIPIDIPPKMAAAETPILVQSSSTDTTDIKHAHLGVVGQTCHYEVDMDLNDEISGQVGGSTPRDEKKKVKGGYTVAVTPASILPQGVHYHVKGHHLIFREKQVSKGRQDTKTKTFTNTFSKCSIEVFQAHGTGAVHPKVVHKPNECPKWMINILIGSIKVLTPAFHNTAKSKALEFSQVEDTDVFGQHQRKMAFSSKEEADGHVSVIGHGMALVQKGKLTSKKEENKMIKDSASQTHKVAPAGNIESAELTVIVKTGDTNGQAPKPIVPASEKTEPVPKGVIADADRPTESVSTISTSVSAHRSKCIKAASTTTHKTTSVEELLAQKVKSGYSVLSEFAQYPHDLQHIADLPVATMGQAVAQVAKALSSMKPKAANAKAASIMELKPIRDEVIAQILEGSLSGHRVAHELLNALGTQLIHSKTSTETAKEVTNALVSVASRDSLPMVTREQAVYALVHDQCHDHKLVIDALDGLLTNDKVSGEMGEFALQVQHGLMHSQSACSSQEAQKQILSSHTNRSARTEALLQKAMKKGNFMNARAHLTALGNSRFARHAGAIASVLKNDDLPDHVHYGAVKALGLLEVTDHDALLGEYVHHHDKWTRNAARDAWTSKFINKPWPSEQSLLQKKKYPKVNKKKKNKTTKEYCTPQEWNEKKEWPLPKTGDFQAVGGVESGIGQSGAKAEAFAAVEVYGDRYKVVSLVAQKQGLGLCSASKPAILELKLADFVVFKRQYGKKSKKTDSKAGAAYKKAGFEALETPLDTAGFCMTNLDENSCLSGEKLWSKTFFEKTFRTWVGPVPLSASIKLSGEWGLKYGIGMLDECEPDSKSLAMIQSTKANAKKLAMKAIRNREKIAAGAKLALRVWERVPTSMDDVEQMAIDALNALIKKAAAKANLGIDEDAIPDLGGFTDDDVKQYVDDVIASAKAESEKWLTAKSGGYITIIPTNEDDIETIFVSAVNKFVKDAVDSSSLASHSDLVPELKGWAGQDLKQYADDVKAAIKQGAENQLVGAINKKLGTSLKSIPRDKEGWAAAAGKELSTLTDGVVDTVPLTVEDFEAEIKKIATRLAKKIWSSVEPKLVKQINAELGLHLTTIPLDAAGWKEVAGKELSILTGGVIEMVPTTDAELQAVIKQATTKLAAKHLPGASQCVEEDTGYKFNGVLAMISPYAKADLTVEAAIDAYVVKAGIAAEIELLSITLPVTMESCLFGDCDNQCFNPQIETTAGGGRAYLFIKTIWSDQDEWDVFNWAGASWLWPAAAADEGYKGFCKGAVDTGPAPPPPPALKETDCIVEIYEDDNYGGKLLKTCNTNQMHNYWCRVKNGGGVENAASSYKMSGWCNKYAVIDEDHGCDQPDDDKVYSKSTPSVPWDLDNDMCGVKIWAAGALIVYQHGDSSGWRADFGEGEFNHAAFTRNGAKNDDASAVSVKKGCKAIIYQHGDFTGWSAVLDATENALLLDHDHFVKTGAKNDDASSVKVACGAAAADLKK